MRLCPRKRFLFAAEKPINDNGITLGRLPSIRERGFAIDYIWSSVVNRKAALSYGRKAAERDAVVIDRFFGSKQKALTWAQTHPHFMTVRILTPDVKLTGN